MPHPITGYRTKDGIRVPGVTTIINKFRNSGGLVHWAWQLGIEGRDYRQVRDDSAAAGTLAHAMVEQWIAGKRPRIEGPTDVVQKAKSAFNLFLVWVTQTRLKIVESEVSLVSDRYRFGGTLDAMLIGDQLSLGDWKTSNRIYSEHLIQLAAYGILWEENYPDRPIAGGYHLMRFAKDTPDFSHHFWAELDDARELFLLYRRAYDLRISLEKRAA